MGKKILHIFSKTGGGTERFIIDFLYCLNKQFKAKQIILFKELLNKSKDFSIKKKNYNEYQIIGPSIFYFKSENFYYKFYNKKFEYEFVKFIKQIKPDLVHIHTIFDLPFLIVKILKKFNIPIIFSIHDTTLLCPRNGFIDSNNDYCLENYNGIKCSECFPEINYINFYFYHQYIKNMLNYDIDILTTVSKATAEIYKYFGINKEINVIYSGINLSCKIPVKSLDKEKVVFGYFGGNSIHKGFLILINALQYIKNKKSKIILYGSNINDTLKTTILKKLNGNLEIIFEKSYNINEIQDVYKKIDVLIFPSYCFETAGLTLLEAKYFKTPIIFSNSNGIPEYAKNNIDGFAFENGNYKQLGKILLKIVDNPKIINEIRERIEPPKKMEDTVDEYIVLYNSLLKEKKINNHIFVKLLNKKEKKILTDLQKEQKINIKKIISNKKIKKIILFGTGVLSKRIYLTLSKTQRNKIKYVFDNDELKNNKIFFGHIIKKPFFIEDIDYIIIASQWFNEIKEQLISLGYPEKKIVII